MNVSILFRADKRGQRLDTITAWPIGKRKSFHDGHEGTLRSTRFSMISIVRAVRVLRGLCYEVLIASINLLRSRFISETRARTSDSIAALSASASRLSFCLLEALLVIWSIFF